MNLSHNQVEAAICYVARTYRRAHVPLTESTEVKEDRGGVWVPAEIFVPAEELRVTLDGETGALKSDEASE